jgi:surface antigen
MLRVFERREEAPSTTNKYYIKTTHGGYNKCILIDESTGSVLPNCTGYAWGRFMECQLNVHDCNLSRGNAEIWYSNIIDGYERGQTPKLGAVMCWSSTQSGGHVAIVEKINQDGSILCSNSAYGGSRFYTNTLIPPDYNMGSAYTFQGFIYNPTEFIDPDDPSFKNKNKRKFPWVLYARKFRKRTQL